MGLSEEDQRILEEMDKIYLDFPIYGSRRMSRELKRRGFKVGRQKAAKGKEFYHSSGKEFCYSPGK